MSVTKSARVNYIFIDYENVQPNMFKFPDEYIFKVFIFVGSNQKKLPIEFVESIQSLGDNAKYILISGSGKNALDFHIAYYLGKYSEESSDGYFHIVSKDSGYDPLVKHIKEKKILINRYSDINDIPAIKSSDNDLLPIDKKVALVAEHLKRRGNTKPRKPETLTNAINSLFARKLNDKQLKEIINYMVNKKLIEIKDKKLSYSLK